MWLIASRQTKNNTLTTYTFPKIIKFEQMFTTIFSSPFRPVITFSLKKRVCLQRNPFILQPVALAKRFDFLGANKRYKVANS